MQNADDILNDRDPLAGQSTVVHMQHGGDEWWYIEAGDYVVPAWLAGPFSSLSEATARGNQATRH